MSFISSNTFAACITVGIQFFLTVSVNKVNYINCFPNIKCPATLVAALLGHGVFRVLSATNLCWPQYCFRWLGSTPRGRQWPNQTFLSLLALRALKISFILPYTSPLSKKKKKARIFWVIVYHLLLLPHGYMSPSMTQTFFLTLKVSSMG